MTVKGFVLFLLIVTVAGCAIFHVIRQQGDGDDPVREWATALGVNETEMLLYLESTTGMKGRVRVNAMLGDKRAAWDAFYTRKDQQFDDLISRYDGAMERDRYLNARRSLGLLARQMDLVRKTYMQDNQEALDALTYGRMLKELASPDFSRLNELSSRNPNSPFLTNDDVQTWHLIRLFVTKLEDESNQSMDLKDAFDGMCFDQTLNVIERMRHEPVVSVLLTAFPTHVALGELFKTLQDELPRP